MPLARWRRLAYTLPNDLIYLIDQMIGWHKSGAVRPL